MSSGPASKLTSQELTLLSLAIVCALVAVFADDGMVRLVMIIAASVSGGAMYLLVARRLNERHVDAVLATRPDLGPDDGREKIVHVDPATRRLVFEDYAPTFGSDDDRYESPTLQPAPVVTPEFAPPVATPPLKEITAADLGDEVRIVRASGPIRVKQELAPPPIAAPVQAAAPLPEPTVTITPPRSVVPTHKRTELHVALPELFDFAAEQAGHEPRNEFDWLLNRVLETIGAIVPAHTVAFFWIDRARQELIVESRITHSTTFTARRRIAAGHDIVNQIAISGMPEILTEIQANAERDLICYYDKPNGVGSFAGVPVYFNKEAVAVLALDALEANAYDARTVWTLGHFTKIISGLIRGYTDKYDLHLSARAVDAVTKLRAALPTQNAAGERIARALLDVAEDIVEWTWAGTALFDAAAREWMLAHSDARSGAGAVAVRQRIDLHGTVVGGVIRSGHPAIIGDVAGNVRFARGEPAAAAGSFLCLPLSTPLRSYGALCMEHPAQGHFTQHDVNTLSVLAQTAAAAIESHHLNKMIDEQLMIDERTGVFNKRYLLGRLDEEVTRASDFHQDLSFVLFGIDDFVGQTERPAPDKIDSLLSSVVRTLLLHVRTYDVVGRYDQDRIGVVLVGKSDDDAYLWTEKVRKEVAGTIVMLGSRKLSVTASAGVCGLRGQTTHVDLVNGSLTALQRAQEIGGNTVMLF